MSPFHNTAKSPETDTWLNSNYLYILDENKPFGKFTDDLVRVLREMKTQHLFSIQAMNEDKEISANPHVFVLMCDQAHQEEESDGIPNTVFRVDPVDVDPEWITTIHGKNHLALARALDSYVMSMILSEPTKMDDVEYDPRRPLIGLWAAQQLIAQKTRRGYATVLVGPKNHPIIKQMRGSKKIYCVPHNIEQIPPVLYYRGRVNLDTSVILAPISFERKDGLSLTLAMIMWKENMVKIVKGEPSEDPSTGGHGRKDEVVL